HDFALIRLIPNHHSAQPVLKGLPSLLAGKADDLIREDVAGGRWFLGLPHFVDHVVHGASDEVDPGFDPAREKAKVVVTAIDGPDGSWGQIKVMSRADVRGAGGGEQHVARQVV